MNEVGFYNNIRYDTYETPNGKQGSGVIGTFNVTSEPLKDHLKGCWDEGYYNPVEFSIDAVLDVHIEATEIGNVNVPYDIDNLKEVTLVNKSAAEGYLISMAAGKKLNKGKDMKRTQLIALLAKIDQSKANSITEKTTDDQIVSMLSDSLDLKGNNENSLTAEKIKAIVDEAIDSRENSPEALEIKLQASNMMVKSLLDQSKLPEQAKEKIIASCSETVMKEEDVLKLIEDDTKMFAAMKKDGVNVEGQEEGKFSVGQDEYDKQYKAFYALFNNLPSYEGQKAYPSLHRAYAHMAGISNNVALDKHAISERIMAEMAYALPSSISQHDNNRERINAGIEQGKSMKLDIQQGVLVPNNWTRALADVTTNTLIDYDPDPETSQWKTIAKITTPAPDYKPQHYSRIPALDNLPIVDHGDPYQSWDIKTDEGTSKAIDTYGLKYKTHISSIVNDDIGAISAIPERIREAADRTLWHAVTDPLLNNPVIGDGNNLFTPGTPHSNEGTLPFSPANLQATSIAMQKQIEHGVNYPLGVRNKPKVLVIPTDLEREVWEAIKASMANFGTTRQETIDNFLEKEQITMVRASHWLDVNDWVALADPQRMETILVSFFENRQEPVILVQDSPTVGDMFNADVLTWRVHYLFLVVAVDYRGAYKHIV